MSTEIAVRLDGITKRSGPVMALGGAGFQLRRGETVTLLGPKGAGKTTTVGILLGLLRPAAGRLLPPRRPPGHRPGAGGAGRRRRHGRRPGQRPGRGPAQPGQPGPGGPAGPAVVRPRQAAPVRPRQRRHLTR